MSAQGRPPGGGDGGDRRATAAAYADRFAGETPALIAARARAGQLAGPPPITPAVGATLAVLAAGAGARGVVVGRQRRRGQRPVAAAGDAPGRRPHLPGRRRRAAAGRAAGLRRRRPPQGRTRMIFGSPARSCPGCPPAPTTSSSAVRADRLRRGAPGAARAAAPRRAAGLLRPARGRPDRRPVRPRPRDGRLARGRPPGARGRAAHLRRPADRRGPPGGQHSPADVTGWRVLDPCGAPDGVRPVPDNAPAGRAEPDQRKGCSATGSHGPPR